MKLLVAEPESTALRLALARWPDLASAALLRTETLRALRRSGNDERVADARRLLRAVHAIRLDGSLLDRAGDLEPRTLRSLDAIHLAAALALGDDLGVAFTYDARLGEALAGIGIEVASPR